MDYTKVKKLSIVEFLQRLGMDPAEKNADYYKYYSPGRDEKTPSLTVYHKKNDWCDFKDKSGGDIGKLVQYLYKCDSSKALSILNEYIEKNLISPCMSHTPIPHQETASCESAFKIVEVKEISDWRLKSYLKERRIPLSLANRYLKEMIYDTPKGSRLNSLAFRNDKGGYVLRHKNQNKPHNTKPAYFTTIEAPGNKQLNLFEGAYDFLSALVYFETEQPAYTTIVLNSLSNLIDALPLLNQFGKINLYLDNDLAGMEAAGKIKALHPGAIDKAKTLYPSNKDFNEFIINTI